VVQAATRGGSSGVSNSTPSTATNGGSSSGSTSSQFTSDKSKGQRRTKLLEDGRGGEGALRGVSIGVTLVKVRTKGMGGWGGRR